MLRTDVVEALLLDAWVVLELEDDVFATLDELEPVEAEAELRIDTSVWRTTLSKTHNLNK